jgi:hypothetical protein
MSKEKYVWCSCCQRVFENDDETQREYLTTDDVTTLSIVTTAIYKGDFKDVCYTEGK